MKEQKRTKIKKEDFLKNFVKCKRKINKTCKRIGISRYTYYNWLNSDNDFVTELEKYEKRTSYNQEMFAETWAKMVTNKSSVCKLIGISRWTYYSWRKNNPDFIKLIDEEFEKEKEFRFK